MTHPSAASYTDYSVPATPRQRSRRRCHTRMRATLKIWVLSTYHDHLLRSPLQIAGKVCFAGTWITAEVATSIVNHHAHNSSSSRRQTRNHLHRNNYPLHLHPCPHLTLQLTLRCRQLTYKVSSWSGGDPSLPAHDESRSFPHPHAY